VQCESQPYGLAPLDAIGNPAVDGPDRSVIPDLAGWNVPYRQPARAAANNYQTRRCMMNEVGGGTSEPVVPRQFMVTIIVVERGTDKLVMHQKGVSDLIDYEVLEGFEPMTKIRWLGDPRLKEYG